MRRATKIKSSYWNHNEASAEELMCDNIPESWVVCISIFLRYFDNIGMEVITLDCSPWQPPFPMVLNIISPFATIQAMAKPQNAFFGSPTLNVNFSGCVQIGA